MQVDRKHIITGIKVFLLITILAFVVIFIVTLKKETFHALRSVKIEGLLIMGGAWIAIVFFDGLRLSMLSYCGEKKLSLWQAAEVLFVGNFMAAVTPFQTGGLPLQLYILNKDGIPPGRGTALLLVRGVIQYIPIFLLAPFAAVKLGIEFPLYRIVGAYIGIIIFMAGFVLFLVLLKPKRLLKRIESKKERSRFYKFLAWAVKEGDTFIQTVKDFFKITNHKYFLFFIIFSTAFLFFYLFFPVFILYGLGIEFSVYQVVAIQLLLSAVLLYMPTPGASGIAETGGALFFVTVCPKSLIGIFVLIWRFFTFYIGAVIGGIITMKKIVR